MGGLVTHRHIAASSLRLRADLGHCDFDVDVCELGRARVVCRHLDLVLTCSHQRMDIGWCVRLLAMNAIACGTSLSVPQHLSPPPLSSPLRTRLWRALWEERELESVCLKGDKRRLGGGGAKAAKQVVVKLAVVDTRRASEGESK